MSQKCPNCRLINPDSALRCDCGYDFNEGVIKQSHLQAAESQKAASKFQELVDATGGVDEAFKTIGKRNIFQGAAWLIGASSLTIVTYVVTGTIALQLNPVRFALIGAFVIGITQFIRGLVQYFGQH
jgi:hypothetical protein